MNKRNFERKTLQYYPEVKLEGFNQSDRLLDISANGLMFVMNESFEINDEIFIKIFDQKVFKFELLVTVKRIKKLRNNQYEIGCQYKLSNEADRSNFLEFIRLHAN